MSEVPSFGGDELSPDITEYLSELAGEMDRELEQKQQAKVESNRASYLNVIANRARAINAYAEDRRNFMKLFTAGTSDEIARSHFLYYMDAILENAVPSDKQEYLVEAFYEADGSQKALNMTETGQPYIYNPQELQGRIAAILLTENIDDIKREIEDMYDRNICEAVRRYMHGKGRSL